MDLFRALDLASEHLSDKMVWAGGPVDGQLIFIYLPFSRARARMRALYIHGGPAD